MWARSRTATHPKNRRFAFQPAGGASCASREGAFRNTPPRERDFRVGLRMELRVNLGRHDTKREGVHRTASHCIEIYAEHPTGSLRVHPATSAHLAGDPMRVAPQRDFYLAGTTPIGRLKPMAASTRGSVEFPNCQSGCAPSASFTMEKARRSAAYAVMASIGSSSNPATRKDSMSATAVGKEQRRRESVGRSCQDLAQAQIRRAGEQLGLSQSCIIAGAVQVDLARCYIPLVTAASSNSGNCSRPNKARYVLW